MTFPSPDLPDLAQKLLDVAKSAGAQAADVVLFSSESRSIEVRDQALEHAESEEALELGLRVLMGQKQAMVSISDSSDEALAEMAARAVVMANLAPDDPYIGLAEPDLLSDVRNAQGLDLSDPEPAPSAQMLEDIARRLEAASLDVPGVSKNDGAGASVYRADVHLANSNGFAGGYGLSQFSTSASAISGDGLEMESDYAFEARTHFADLPAPEVVGRLAGTRAVERAGARKPPTGAYPVLYDERIASSLIGHLLSAVNGASIARGSSWLRDAMGETVLPASLSITEDPFRPRVFGSRPFDAEGLRKTRSDIVKDGVLQRWTLDLATSRQLGLESTANASRSPGGAPSPSLTNIALTQGTASRAELLAEMGTGLLITSMIGSTINATTGDYSRGAAGFWVEKGEITYPVNECTVAGNLRDMLMTLTPANDARTHLSRVVPSLRVEGLTIAGA